MSIPNHAIHMVQDQYPGLSNDAAVLRSAIEALPRTRDPNVLRALAWHAQTHASDAEWSELIGGTEPEIVRAITETLG